MIFLFYFYMCTIFITSRYLSMVYQVKKVVGAFGFSFFFVGGVVHQKLHFQLYN